MIYTGIKKLKVRLLLILFFAAALSACSPSITEKITVHGPVSVNIVTNSKVNVGVVVENCMAHRLRLERARLTFYRFDERIAVVMLDGAVTIARCSVEYVELPLRVRITNQLLALTIDDIEALDWENITVTAEITGKIGLLRRSINLNRVPAEEIFANFGTRSVFFSLPHARVISGLPENCHCGLDPQQSNVIKVCGSQATMTYTE